MGRLWAEAARRVKAKAIGEARRSRSSGMGEAGGGRYTRGMWIILAAGGMALALVIVLLLSGRRTEAIQKAAATADARTCPLCGSILSPGERVRSDLTPGTGDRIMRIFGCPHCEPGSPLAPARAAVQARICPYCRGEVPMDGWVVARYFERPGRKHVHVLGCTRCRPENKSKE